MEQVREVCVGEHEGTLEELCYFQEVTRGFVIPVSI